MTSVSAMDRSWISSILLLLILFVSNASSRGLLDEQPPKDTSNSTTTQSPPLPNVTPVGDVKSNGTSPEPSLPTTNSTSTDPKESDSASPPPPPPPQLRTEGEKNVTVVSNTTEAISPPPPPTNQTDSVDKGKLPDKVAPPPKSLESGGNEKVAETGNPPPAKDPEKVDDVKGSSESGIAETCAEKSKICRTENSLVACTLSIEKDSSKWSILVQNEGEESLKAKIVLPVNSLPELTLTKRQSQRVNISISGDTTKIVLEAGKGECVLHMYSPKEKTYSIHLPSYEKLVTPINGAYFLIVSVVIFGGAWGFCLCRKNHRADNGVPYRELEMSGGPGLESAHDVETADWDEGWDDDWDENNAVKSPGGAANSVRISANGLTARASNRDGWDHDWDD